MRRQIMCRSMKSSLLSMLRLRARSRRKRARRPRARSRRKRARRQRVRSRRKRARRPRARSRRKRARRQRAWSRRKRARRLRARSRRKRARCPRARSRRKRARCPRARSRRKRARRQRARSRRKMARHLMMVILPKRMKRRKMRQMVLRKTKIRWILFRTISKSKTVFITVKTESCIIMKTALRSRIDGSNRMVRNIGSAQAERPRRASRISGRIPITLTPTTRW